MMKKLKKKTCKKYSDFYTNDDLFEAKCPPINLSIADMDSRGHVANPKAPCVVTTIDPQYTIDANHRGNFHKFNVKSDILRLRDITRKKFLLYVTQQRALEKKQEQEFKTKFYEETIQFLSMTANQLSEIQDKCFRSVLEENEKLKILKSSDKSKNMKDCISKHQKLSTDVKDIHKRFIFLLKLIGYFDVNEDAINILKLKNLAIESDFDFLQSDLLSDFITKDHIKQLKEFLNKVVKPYLDKNTYLDVDFWIAGYENTRRKLFEYYHQFTKLAILNHIVSVIHNKYIKSHKNCTSMLVVHNTSSYLKNRRNRLVHQANETLEAFEKKQIHGTNKIHWHIKGVAPMMLEKIQQKSKEEKQNSRKNAIDKLEEIHTILMNLLNDVDKLEPDHCKHLEDEVRRCVAREKKASRKVLTKVNRFQNWIEHYHKH